MPVTLRGQGIRCIWLALGGNRVALQLGFCREIADYVRCAGSIGSYLLRRGCPIAILDANGPIGGVTGLYSEARGRKYFKGPHRPRLGDLADTELAIYGM